MKIILNADDFGLTESVNNAIVDCFKMGIVKSTTIMMNQPGTQHAVDLYHQGLIDQVGLHFTVTAGKPILDANQVSTLVDEEGYFLERRELYGKTDVCSEQVYKELKAQYHAALNAGLAINHLDSHHFGGVFPNLKATFTRFANDVGLPVRRTDNIIEGQDLLKVATPDAFDLGFYDAGASLEHLKTMLTHYQHTMPDGIVEFMCHPAKAVTAELKQLSGYTDKRVTELDILTSIELKNWLAANNIECIGFDALHSR
ncbi:carbohydrate deacetylase [Vibrio methylphosphonaticus]|uniref:carbohydrate deacetylase n=1 Tax=Vibrio methylphosphonaticus TaxID=2946866 RepID=UPI002029FEBE|nr:carbohydrate deacetylase [Vibrio methylphosphonaticus]MCL9775679.1 carbohydrate deacetylase [Vibrio methylphosphonaticus]